MCRHLRACVLGWGLSRAPASVAFPGLSALKQAKTTAAALPGPRLPQAPEAGLEKEKGPPRPGSRESLSSAPPAAGEEVYQMF